MAFSKKLPAWLLACALCVSGAEGLRTVAYKDPVGIPTICFGETKGVKLGDRKSVEHCEGLLIKRLAEFDRGVSECVRVALPDTRRAALVSFAYNVGVPAFCGSTLVAKLNVGDIAGACDQMRRWVYAKGVKFPGLVKRREEERALCLA